nr:unnamed protein product [Digitaria exilis]
MAPPPSVPASSSFLNQTLVHPAHSRTPRPTISNPSTDVLGRTDDSGQLRMPSFLPPDRRYTTSANDLCASTASLRGTSASTSNVWETLASSSQVAMASNSNMLRHASLATPRALASAAFYPNLVNQVPPQATGAIAPSLAAPATLGAALRDALLAGSAAQHGLTKPNSLSAYGRDMMADAGKMEPVIGRDDEIDRVIRILCRCNKNNAILVGAPGVGKTAIGKGLAQRIAVGHNVPATLSGVRVVELDLAAMMAGAILRGMFEERLKNMIQEAEVGANGKVILFIDDMHMLLGAGNNNTGSLSAANLLKPGLARGHIRCMGTTTCDEYRKHIEKDAAFERQFQVVLVKEPSLAATIAILRGLKRKYEEHPSAITRIHTDKQLNGNNTLHSLVDGVKKAIVCPDQAVSQFTGIPVNTLAQDEKVKLMHLADRLQERVVGQQEAATLVAQAVLRSRAGLDQPGQPIGSFLFLGSTGVGKTELAKALAEQLFDSEKMLIRFDMTEFVGSHSVLRLIGAPPSYHGYEDGGQLIEKVRQRPYSVILFDEIEKADPAVFNVFLQLLDDGVLTDGKGRTVDFKNTIIIMTSNLGAEYLVKAMTGEISMEAARNLVIKQAEKHFKPEFLNRLSEIVVFEPLSQDKLRLVANAQMKGIIARLADKGINISASEAALDVVLSGSYNPLAEMHFKGEVDVDTTVTIDASEDKKDLKYKVVKNVRRPDKRVLVEVSSDSGYDHGIDLNRAPVEKKMKGVAYIL